MQEKLQNMLYIQTAYVSTNQQPVNLLTKALRQS